MTTTTMAMGDNDNDDDDYDGVTTMTRRQWRDDDDNDDNGWGRISQGTEKRLRYVTVFQHHAEGQLVVACYTWKTVP